MRWGGLPRGWCTRRIHMWWWLAPLRRLCCRTHCCRGCCSRWVGRRASRAPGCGRPRSRSGSSRLAVPCYLAWERLVRRVKARDLLTAAGRCVGLALLVSLYWIVPVLAASGTGQAIAFHTERPQDVASASSYAETLRLLGLWTLYGRQGDRLFLPSFAAFVTSPLVVLGSFLFPIAAAVGAFASRARARALAVILLAVALPIMVGLFPAGRSSPFGRLLEQAFQRVPGAIAFRTTNKVGALAALGIS